MRKKYIAKILTLDTETYGLGGKIRRIALYNGKTVKYGYKFSDIENYLIEYTKYGVMPHIFVHNLGFDSRKMPEVFQDGNVDWNKTVSITNSFARLTCKYYVFHDSYKILPNSLEKLSKDFDVEHGKLDLWTEVQNRYPNVYKDKVDYFNRVDADDELYLKYLGYDVMSLYEILQKLIELSGLSEQDLCKILSTSSLSRYLFKNGWKGKIFKNPKYKRTDFQLLCSNKMWHSEIEVGNSGKTYREVEEIIRRGSYGGRTEVFKPYTGIPKTGYTALHYDVNSLYPSQMAVKHFPIGEPEVYTDTAELVFEEWLRYHQGLGFLECDIYIPKQNVPPLPSRKEKTAFFTGHISGVWTYVEIEYAVNHCGAKIEKYKTAVHFKNTYPVFKNFIETFYTVKEEASKEGNESLRNFAKLIMNVAFGYTIMNRDDKTELHNISGKSVEELQAEFGDELVHVSEWYGYYETKADVDARYIQPQIGAYVTSYARLVLLDALKKAEKEGEIYYCDTDSVVCENPMPDEIVDPYKLGFWDLESIVYEGTFLQPKVYEEIVISPSKKRMSDNRKFKGVKRSVVQSFSREKYDEIFDALKEEELDSIVVETGRETLRGFFYCVKNNIDVNTIDITDKSINLKNPQKRIMDYKNNSSKPYHFETLADFEKFKFNKIEWDYFEKGSVFGSEKNWSFLQDEKLKREYERLKR